MEKEERSIKCSPLSPRQGKKKLFIFVAINICVILLIFFKSNFYNLNYDNKFNHVKPEHSYIYQVPLFHIPFLNVKDMIPFYVEIKTDIWCFRSGIKLQESKTKKQCICSDSWFGLDCGIPAAVWNSSYLQEGKNAGVEIRRRDKPRRIIVSYAVDDYIDLLDVNIRSIFSTVDLFLTVEQGNNPSILNMFKAGYLIEYQSKIIPVHLNKTLEMKMNNIHFLFNELWAVGWKKLADFRPDDLLLFSHVSSIISKDILLFLKLYDGYPEPLSFELRPLLFKFWRQIKNNISSKIIPFSPLGCTVQYIASMCDFDVLKLLTNTCINDSHHRKLFEKSHWQLKNWSIGNSLSPSGWQCTWCCKKDCILRNISKYAVILKNDTSLPLGNLGNISVIDPFNGINNSNKYFASEIISSSDPFFAPNIVIQDKKYEFLIDLNPSSV